MGSLTCASLQYTGRQSFLLLMSVLVLSPQLLLRCFGFSGRTRNRSHHPVIKEEGAEGWLTAQLIGIRTHYLSTPGTTWKTQFVNHSCSMLQHQRYAHVREGEWFLCLPKMQRVFKQAAKVSRGQTDRQTNKQKHADFSANLASHN